VEVFDGTPIIEPQAGGIAYIPTNVILYSGQIFLETNLINAGIRPCDST